MYARKVWVKRTHVNVMKVASLQMKPIRRVETVRSLIEFPNVFKNL